MWQTVEYKAAAIEQFRKGDLLQRVIEDVQSEAANAAEMKAAASGNPLILMQVRLASDLRKLEALHSQHQRSQYRLKDRLKWLSSAQERLAKAEAVYAENMTRRDAHTRTLTEKGKTRILPEFAVNGTIFGEKDKEKIMDALRGGVKAVTREQGKKHSVGSYRGFDVYMLRNLRASDADGFRFMLKGTGDQEFHPDNLTYTFDEKFSLSGFFQRMDNFLEKGLEQAFQTYKANAGSELVELETVKAVIGQEFPQKDELALTRENHGAVMRELQRMQNVPGYVSEWQPKTSLAEQESPPQEAAQEQDAHAFKDEAEKRFGPEASNRVVFASVVQTDSPGALPATAGTTFTDAGFSASYAGDGSLRGYRKCPQKTDDGGEITIRVEPVANGAFSVLAEYEKNHILDERRKHAATASSVNEALEVVANFEKYLLPETALAVEQPAPSPGMRMR
jgi:hypothetical protein